MSIFRCKLCGGLYSCTMGDGTTYYHVCAPVDDLETGNSRKRPKGRDENLAAPKGNRPPVIKAEGKGVECVNHPGLAEPAWITKQKARALRDEEV